MTVKRGTIDLEDTNDEQDDQETDNQRLDREEREAQDKRLADAEKARVDAEIAKARAEGEADALRRGVKTEAAPAAAALSDAQWSELEQAHGKTRQQIMADAQLTRATTEEAMKPLRAALDEARKEAAEARSEAKKARAGTSLYSIEKEFYDKNPGLVGHKGEVGAFLNKFPEDVRNDPAKLKELLDDAKVYVRGKVREDRGSVRRDRGEDRVERRDRNTERPQFDDEDDREDESKVDTSDLDNEGARRLVENIARRPGGEDLADAPPAIDEVSVDKAYKLSERSDGRGVSIDERGEFARGRRQSEKSLRDTRPLRMSEDERDRRDRR